MQAASSTDGGTLKRREMLLAILALVLIWQLMSMLINQPILGERWRVYGGAGPMLQWATYDQESDEDNFNGKGSGFTSPE